MNKIILASLVLLGMFASKLTAGDSSLIGGAKAHYYTTVTGSSMSYTNDPHTVYSITLTSGNGSDFAVLFDTDVMNSVPGGPTGGLNAFRASPAVVFSSNPMSGSVNSPLTNPKIDFGPTGRRLNLGGFLLKSAGQSGEANIAVIDWSY